PFGQRLDERVEWHFPYRRSRTTIDGDPTGMRGTRNRRHVEDVHPWCVPVRGRRRAWGPIAAHAWRPGARSRIADTLPAARGPAHPHLLRPPLQRALDRRAGHIDDVGEPD